MDGSLDWYNLLANKIAILSLYELNENWVEYFRYKSGDDDPKKCVITARSPSFHSRSVNGPYVSIATGHSVSLKY